MKYYFNSLIAALCLLAGSFSFQADACSSVIVSGKVTASGKPLMLKVRDNKSQDNNVQFFNGEKYNFYGLVVNARKANNKQSSVVGGYNDAGLCIMSLTSGGFPLDSADNKISGGKVMFKALGTCKNIREFENMAKDMLKDGICITHLGMIDAEGGAAYFEFGGEKYVKYDVNNPNVAPDGYRVCTNFAWSGNPKLGSGQERYDNALSLMKDFKKNADGKYEIDHQDLIDAFGRTPRSELIGIRDFGDMASYKYFPDRGFIIRAATCAVFSFEGVKKGEDPKHTVAWIQFGSPVCCPAFPLVLATEYLPGYIYTPKKSSQLHEKSMAIRDKFIYDRDVKDDKAYFNVAAAKELCEVSKKTDAFIDASFSALFTDWVAKKKSDEEFRSAYINAMETYYQQFLTDFAKYE